MVPSAGDDPSQPPPLTQPGAAPCSGCVYLAARMTNADDAIMALAAKVRELDRRLHQLEGGGIKLI